jgi:hypothetical protein
MISAAPDQPVWLVQNLRQEKGTVRPKVAKLCVQAPCLCKKPIEFH